MDTNVQALKNLYVALGGNASDVEGLTTSSEMINKIKEAVGPVCPDLPVGIGGQAVLTSGNKKMEWLGGPVGASNFEGTKITIFKNLDLLKGDGYPIGAIILIRGYKYLFHWSATNSSFGKQYLNVERTENSTIFRTFVIPSDASGSQYDVDLVVKEIPDPTVPEA